MCLATEVLSYDGPMLGFSLRSETRGASVHLNPGVLSQPCRGDMDTGDDSLEVLPIDVLCQIVKHLELHDKLRLQLVCRKLNALLISPPQGESLWGEFHLPATFKCSRFQNDTEPVLRR